MKKKSRIGKAGYQFVSYDGHIPELNMFINDGYYFKMYLPEESFSKFFMEDSLCCSGFKIQLIASKNQVYELLGIQSDSPEEAEEKFRQFESKNKYYAAACQEWFDLMSKRLKFEAFSEILQGKRTKKLTKINGVQPYKIIHSQKSMELSGKTVKTVILMGYPSRMFPAFCTELVGIADNLVFVLFVEQMDAKRCMDGMNLSKTIQAMRREAMESFLRESIRNGTRLYNICALVAIDGLPGEVEEIFQRLKEFCRKYLVSVSELDYQQADAWKSTLPLMKNRIHYYRVLTEDNLKALLPWSELKNC